MNSNYNSFKRQLPLINLLGEESENFYQLGNKDKACWEKIRNATGFLTDKGLITPIHKGIFYLLRKHYDTIDKSSTFFHALDSYSKGIESDPFELYRFMITGEVFSTSGPWPRSYPRNYTYSSSIYFKAAKSEKIILIKNWEGPFSSKISNFLRLTHSHFHNRTDSLFPNYPGHPFPYQFVSLANGLQVSAHQMISDTLEINGKSLAQILFEIQSVPAHIQDIKEYFLAQSGLSSSFFTIWVDQQSFIEVYLNGAAVDFKEQNIKEENLWVYSSRSDFTQKTLFNHDYEYGLEKTSSRALSDLTQKNSDIDALKALCLPNSEEVNPFSYMNPFNSFCLSFDQSEEKVAYIEGGCPKNYEDGTTFINGIWQSKIINDNQIFRNVPEDGENFLHRGLIYFNLTQDFLDKASYREAHHHIQMGLACLPSYHPLKDVYEFYFSAIEFIVDNNKKTRYRLINSFREHLKLVPDPLKDHCRIFVNRLEKLIGLKEFSYKEFDHPHFEELNQMEQKCPSVFLSQLIKKSMAINIHLHIIEYGHYQFLVLKPQSRVT
ncbi:MAG: hypothetical protein ACO20H_11935 [Bacteriovoracaceae bacterium]